MRRLPITIANDHFDPHGGGSENYFAGIARWLLGHGHPVRLFARRPDSNFPVSMYAIARPAVGIGSLSERSFSRSLIRHLRGTGGAVLSGKPYGAATHYVLTSGIYRRAFQAECEACESGLRKILFPLGDRLNSKRRWLISNQEALLADGSDTRLLVFSSALKRELISEFGTSSYRILVGTPGVDLQRFHPAPAEMEQMETPDFLFIAHNFELKGLRNVLLALEQTHRRGVKAGLQVVGRGDGQAFNRLIASLRLTGFVRFHGLVDDEVKDRLLRECTALVHPTFYDPCSLVVLEALASGSPVITTSRNGAAELMVSGRHGYVLGDPRDFEALAAAMLALADRSKQAETRRNVLELREDLSFEKHAQTVACWLAGGQ